MTNKPLAEVSKQKNPLIIDLRDQLPWRKRYISNTGTLLLWGAWLLLWRPMVVMVELIYEHKISLLDHLFDTFRLVLENGFTALVACAITLWMWSTLVSPKAKRATEPKELNDYAKYFGLNQEHLQDARKQKVVYVHHNQDGKITHLN